MIPVRLVLLRPRNADNLGAVARAMKNFGLADWVVVSPNPELLEAPGLNRLAVKAFDLLETVRRVDTLDEALQDCHYVVGTTMRRVEGRRRLTPKELADEAFARGGRLALVFGDERSGMTNEDLARCQALSYIPTSEEQPSLNLAQAVVVYAWELFERAHAGAAPAPLPAPADDAQVQALQDALGHVLRQGGFLQDESRHAVADLVEPLVRSRLAKKEAALWLAALRALGKKGPQP